MISESFAPALEEISTAIQKATILGSEEFSLLSEDEHIEWVGRFPTRSTAEVLERTLQKQGFETFIVHDI